MLVVENSSATPGPTVAISGVVIEGGASEFYGGGIAEYSGALFVEDSTISGNIAGITGPPSATGYGGGIWSQDGTSLTVEDSTISGNSATADGGGILTGDGTLTVEDSTISGNTSGAGGGIAMFLDSAATVEDSTISGNNSGGSFASGIYVEGPVTLAADIIAKQAIGPECQEVMGGTQIMDAGYNVDDDGTCGFSSANHSVSDSPVIDDYLGTLASNGGPTETVPLLAIPSPTTAAPDPAFEAIPSTFDLPVAENGVSLACSVPDQRGFARNASCDMGAFETSIDTVTFNSEGGSAVGSLSGLDGTTITLPAAPTRAGYSFNGWFTASSGGSALTSPYTVIGSVTLYAQWTANATDRYSYAAGAGSGTAPASGSGLDGTTITLAANTFSDPGYTFAGWSDGTKAYAAGAAYLLSSGGGSITFTAQWTPNSTDILTFDSGGGSAVGSLSGLDGTTITLPAAPTRAGYSFDGWFNAPSGGSALTSPYTLTGSFTLYAQWTAEPTTSILIPSQGATLSGSTYLDASASNATSVKFLLLGGTYGLGGSVVCTATLTDYGWMCALNTTTVPNGAYTLVSEAFGPGGSTFSSGVNITVKNLLPITSVLIPSTGATLSGSTYLDASASNATSVKFLLFGGTYGYSAPVVCTATATAYGWLCSWPTTTVPNGSYTLVSEAFGTGGSAFSTGVGITVKN